MVECLWHMFIIFVYHKDLKDSKLYQICVFQRKVGIFMSWVAIRKENSFDRMSVRIFYCYILFTWVYLLNLSNNPRILIDEFLNTIMVTKQTSPNQKVIYSCHGIADNKKLITCRSTTITHLLIIYTLDELLVITFVYATVGKL